MRQLLRGGACLAASLVLLIPASLRVRAAQTNAFTPNNLIVSRSVYAGNSNTVSVGQTLPPGCVSGTVKVPLIKGGTTNVTVSCSTANTDGTYPNIFNNDQADGSFGVTSPIFLDQMTTGGQLINTLPIDSSRIVTSFSSKSELALNLSDDGNSITFGGYVGGTGFLTAPNQLDISNSNTPGVVDPTNPVVSQYYRAVAEVDASGNLNITNGNAYSGNNGRAAVKANSTYYMAGNDNNGGLSKTQLTTTQVGVNLVNSTGVELLNPNQAAPLPPNINKIGDFEVTQVGYTTADKPGKDNNFRGITVFNNTLYVTKGSGGNGINTVYQVGTAGTLPTAANAPGGNLLNVPITILPGFSTTLASGVALDGTANNPVSFPFGIWFANATTLYVADEGDGALVNPPVNGNVADAATLATAGLQKWVLNPMTKSWQRVYTLQNGLKLGVPYSVPNGPNGEVYPVALNPAAGGLRNLTGQVNSDGTVSIWAITSTLSTNGDQGADPNQLVMITDNLGNADPGVAAGETFKVLRTAAYGEVLRGVSFTPGTIRTASANVQGNVTIGEGQVLNLSRGTVTGNVKLQGGTLILGNGSQVAGNIQVSSGTLLGSNSTVGGNVQLNGGGTFAIEPGTAIRGNLEIQHLPASDQPGSVCGASIAGNLDFHDNNVPASIGLPSGCAGNVIGGNLQVINNSAPVDVFGNSIGGHLQCQQNQAIIGGNNTASMKQGQCSSF